MCKTCVVIVGGEWALGSSVRPIWLDLDPKEGVITVKGHGLWKIGDLFFVDAV
jgi:hypothetical protein